MSGIVGIVHLDGAPVLPEILQQLTDFLAFRGPDGQRTWLRETVGFGSALLSVEGAESAPALATHGELCIVADARIDGRRELEGKLRASGQAVLPSAGDAGLILLAYRQWGEKCLEHLLGDFSFAIWDGRRRRLFCARDQIGIKPFFYAHVGPLLIFSNTLDCIRQHPAISDRLNDLSIADFLLFDMIQDPAGTSFTDVNRLPAAHFLLSEQGRGDLSIQRYWTPPLTAAIEYRRSEEYVQHFQELFDTAVADRLGTGNACVFMSGGLDSTMVAASAARVASREGGDARVWAFTQVFNSLLPHDERQYASLAAQALQIPIEYRADDNVQLFQDAREGNYSSPEPAHSAWPNLTAQHLRRVSSEGRIVLTGLGADPLLSGRISIHFRELLRQNRWGRALGDAARYLSAEGRMSRLYLRTRLRILLTSKQTGYGFFPTWLNEDFANNLKLRERRDDFASTTLAAAGALRPEAHQVTFAPFWPDVFGSYDAGVTGVPAEVRHPFFDLRLVNFLLALPRLPWCCDKQILREAGRGTLPDAVRLRRKSPLRAHPLVKLLERPEAAWVDSFEPSAALEWYVTRSRIPTVLGETDPWASWINLRPLSLEYWLRGLNSARGKTQKDAEYAVGFGNRSRTPSRV